MCGEERGVRGVVPSPHFQRQGRLEHQSIHRTKRIMIQQGDVSHKPIPSHEDVPDRWSVSTKKADRQHAIRLGLTSRIGKFNHRKMNLGCWTTKSNQPHTYNPHTILKYCDEAYRSIPETHPDGRTEKIGRSQRRKTRKSGKTRPKQPLERRDQGTTAGDNSINTSTKQQANARARVKHSIQVEMKNI